MVSQGGGWAAKCTRQMLSSSDSRPDRDQQASSSEWGTPWQSLPEERINGCKTRESRHSTQCINHRGREEAESRSTKKFDAATTDV